MKLAAIAASFLLASLPAFAQEAQSEASLAVSTEAPGNVFADSSAPKFLFKGKASGEIAYEVLDWKGARVGKGSWSAAKPLELSKLGRGAYFLKLSGYSGDVPFGIVEDPAKRAWNPDSFFAMDTAQSWLAAQKNDNPRQPQDGFSAVSDICRLAGLNYVRERLSWGGVAKTKDNPPEWGKYMRNADLLSERGIKVSGMFHDAPKWAKDGSGKLPSDLFALHDFCKKAAISFNGKMADWEFWNEEDISFNDQTVWDFATAQKTAYLGFKEGNPDIPVLNGALCVYPLPAFSEKFFQNGAGDYLDVFNYHVYSPFNAYPKIIADLRALLARHKLQNAQIWLTENGSSYEGAGKLDSFIKGAKEHDKSQELIMTEFTPKAQILMQSLGVARDFFFVLPAYNEREGSKAWGLLRYDYTAKPAYFAFANMTSVLANAKYLGEAKLGDGIRGFLYEAPDKSQTLAFWSESELDAVSGADPKIDIGNELKRPFVLKGQAKGKAFAMTDVVGTESQAKANASGELALAAVRYVSYLKGLSGVAVSKPAPETGRINLKRDASKDLSIVFKAKLGEGFRLEAKNFATLDADAGKMTFEVYNFSSEAKRGKVSVEGSARISGLPDEVEIPPYGKISVQCLCETSEGSPFNGDAVFGGVFNGKKASPLRIDFVSERKLIDSTDKKSFDFANPARWRKNSSGDMKASFDAAEKAVRFDVKFPKGVDRWIYPEYVLEKGKENLAGALGVSFEIKAVQKSGSSEFFHKLLMAVTQNVHETGSSASFEYNSLGKDWTRSTVFFSETPDFNPADVKILRLGMNPKEDELSYWIRDVKVLYPKQAAQPK